MSRTIAMLTQSCLLVRTECGQRLAWAKGPEQATDTDLDEGLTWLGFARCSPWQSTETGAPLSLVYRTGPTPPEAVPAPATAGVS